MHKKRLSEPIKYSTMAEQQNLFNTFHLFVFSRHPTTNDLGIRISDIQWSGWKSGFCLSPQFIHCNKNWFLFGMVS